MENKPAIGKCKFHLFLKLIYANEQLVGYENRIFSLLYLDLFLLKTFAYLNLNFGPCFFCLFFFAFFWRTLSQWKNDLNWTFIHCLYHDMTSRMSFQPLRIPIRWRVHWVIFLFFTRYRIQFRWNKWSCNTFFE